MRHKDYLQQKVHLHQGNLHILCIRSSKGRPLEIYTQASEVTWVYTITIKRIER